MAEKEWMTYSQIAERLGVTPDAIRHRSRKEGWQRQEGNDGKIRVLIDPELLSEIPARNGTDSGPDSARNSAYDSGLSDREIRRLEDQNQMLLRLIDRLDRQHAEHQNELARQRAEHAANQEWLIKERDAAQVEAQKARDAADKAKAEQLQIVLEFSEKHAELHADRARLTAESERLHAELEQARRPWWRRMLGR
jgi:uncharacterized protein YjcR